MAPATRKPVIAGNWKMHHDHLVAIQVVQKLSYRLDEDDYEAVDVVVCPPFTDLRTLQTLIEADKLKISLGAQNCSFENRRFTMVGLLRAPSCWPTPGDTRRPSVKARAGTWHVAHETVPSFDSRESK